MSDKMSEFQERYEDELISVSDARKLVEQIVGVKLEMIVIRVVNQHVAPMVEDLIRRILPEQIEVAIKKFLPNTQGNNENDVQAKRLTLQFTNKPSLTIYGGEEIKAEDGANIKVALVDANSGLIVESGPEAEAKLQTSLLEVKKEDDDGIWTSEMFKNKIVRERAGTKLSGDLVFKLNRGIGIIENIKLAKSSTPMKNGFFKLGASLLDTRAGIQIEEGKSESFTGKDFRNKYNMKSQIPELSDNVWKLNKISRNKQIHKRLQEEGIHTVNDFLLRFFHDPEELRRISGMRNKDWEVAVQHACICKLDQRMNSGIESEGRNGVVQNIQVPGMLGECSTMYRGSASAVHSDLNVSEYLVHEQTIGEHHTFSPSYIQDFTSNLWEFEVGCLGDNQANQFEDQIHEAYAEHQIDTSRAELDKPRPSKSWVVLINVLIMRGSMRRKRVSFEKLPVPKKQKISYESFQ